MLRKTNYNYWHLIYSYGYKKVQPLLEKKKIMSSITLDKAVATDKGLLFLDGS